MFISARDHARLGTLILRRGVWAGRRLLSDSWIEALTDPCPLKPGYGLLWWLNTDRAQYPAAPETSVFAVGMGTNLIWIDPALDLVVVARWVAEGLGRRPDRQDHAGAGLIVAVGTSPAAAPSRERTMPVAAAGAARPASASRGRPRSI
jgi:CubicO group peptidase (beta-lactamase class C family)